MTTLKVSSLSYFTDLLSVRTGLAVVGKGCIAAQWAVNVIYIVELFPTVVRNVGYATASTCARISAIIASYIPDLVSNVFHLFLNTRTGYRVSLIDRLEHQVGLSLTIRSHPSFSSRQIFIHRFR